MGHLTYLFINLAALSVPFLFSFHPRLKFHTQWFAFWPAAAISALAFCLWDALYTSLGVWGFNPRYISGLYIGNLPLEEVMFFICIPYSSLFTYHCLNILMKKSLSPSQTRFVSIVLITLLIVVGIVYYQRLYTGVTFLLCAALLSLLSIRRVPWLGAFYRAFTVVLIPFFVVNGLLTGTLMDEPVVWYDNSQNLGLRLLSIPVEDVFYGMLLLLLCTTLYEDFRSRRAIR